MPRHWRVKARGGSTRGLFHWLVVSRAFPEIWNFATRVVTLILLFPFLFIVLVLLSYNIFIFLFFFLFYLGKYFGNKNISNIGAIVTSYIMIFIILLLKNGYTYVIIFLLQNRYFKYYMKMCENSLK